MKFWNRLRYGYEQDLDERAHAIELSAYRDALSCLRCSFPLS